MFTMCSHQGPEGAPTGCGRNGAWASRPQGLIRSLRGSCAQEHKTPTKRPRAGVRGELTSRRYGYGDAFAPKD